MVGPFIFSSFSSYTQRVDYDWIFIYRLSFNFVCLVFLLKILALGDFSSRSTITGFSNYFWWTNLLKIQMKWFVTFFVCEVMATILFTA